MPHAPLAPDWEGKNHSDTPHFDGETYEPERDQERLAKQLNAVRTLMSDHVWRTLQEISLHVKAPEASVSARLRDLRKEHFGGHVVGRRYIGDGEWEYAMDPEPTTQKVITPAPVIPIFVCTGCGARARENDLSSKYGKPQVVGHIRDKRLMEAKCLKCDSRPHKGLQAIWREQ